jgi:DNA-binding transcriptional regulator LsrR (DeoR family)
MADDRGNRIISDDVELATRAAWLYYEAALTQAEISSRLRVPPAKVQRLIARARADGLVRIVIEGDLAGCLLLERELARRFKLDFCRVVPELSPGGNPFSALGRAAAPYLHDAFGSGRHQVVGVGHGRTLAATVDHLQRDSFPGLTIVSVLGGVPRRIAANPFDVVQALAEKTEAEAYLLPVPFFANTRQDRAVLLAQRGVPEALKAGETASLFVAGIGEVSETGFMCRSGMILPEEIARARHDGAVAEMFGSFYDAEGQRIATELHERVIALPPEAMRGRDALGIAGGIEKAAAIRAMLNSGLLTALVTDERTARAIIGTATHRAKPNISIVGS